MFLFNCAYQQPGYQMLNDKALSGTWSGESLNDTAFLFYSGNRTTQTQAIRFIGNQRMKTTTNEVVYYHQPGLLTMPVSRLWVAPEMDEVCRHPSWFFGACAQFEQWWMNGVSVDDSRHVLDYEPLYRTDESGSVVHYGLYNEARSLGQITDINAHQRKYQALVETMHPKHIIAVGVSRGAATTFSAIANNDYDNIKLCVLEGVPSSIRALFKSYFSHRMGSYLYNDWTAYWLLGHQHRTDKTQQAFGYVERFPNDIPLVIISSQKDGVVPHEVSVKLALRVAAKRLLAQDKGEHIAPVYLLQLDYVGHNDYARCDKPDGIRYQNFMHAVYRAHHLPYIEEFALRGESELFCADLTAGALMQQVCYQGMFKTNKSERHAIRQQALASFYEQRQTWDDVTKARATQICRYMPLHHKPLEQGWFSFFKVDPANALLIEDDKLEHGLKME
jgi:hypothetical protein